MKTPTPAANFEVKPFGELKPGDVLLAPDGGEVTVKVAYDKHIPDRMYRLELENGVTIEASGNHLWYIEPDEDKYGHGERLAKARKLLKGHTDWMVEALHVAESDEPYEIGLTDLKNFFDFIEDEDERAFFLIRIAESIGHIVEEETILEDPYTGEQTFPTIEKVYDARRFFQQALSLSGKRAYRKRWPVIVGRVVTTDVLFHRYPTADIPTL